MIVHLRTTEAFEGAVGERPSTKADA